MPRKLKPCGTYAAYARHLRNGEKPCGPCNAANNERAALAPSGFNHYGREMDRALDADPPQIVWRKDSHGILRAVSVSDRHAEGTTAAQARRLRAAAEIAEREEAARQAEITRLQVLELMRDEADEVAEWFRKHRADITPLMSATRRSI